MTHLSFKTRLIIIPVLSHSVAIQAGIGHLLWDLISYSRLYCIVYFLEDTLDLLLLFLASYPVVLRMSWSWMSLGPHLNNGNLSGCINAFHIFSLG